MKTLFIGQNAIDLKSIDSTNSYASELLSSSTPPEGTLIYTFNQENGRGQRGNNWYSEPNKNATLSYILQPSFLQADKQFSLNKITCLAVADLLAEMLGESAKEAIIKIKWPNDIYVGRLKIAGILIENTLRESNIKNSIIGFGININQTAFKENIRATSLSLLTNKEFDLMQCIERLSEFLEARYLQLKANKLESINSEYLEKLFQLNIWENYSTNGEFFTGMIVGVSAIGRLQVKLQSEEIKEFNLKEIDFLV